MSKPTFHARACGQSIWLDEISRAWLQSGRFAQLVADDGVSGVTANPSILEQAIGETNDYDAAIAGLARDGCPSQAIMERLAIEDLQTAADLLRPCYERSGGTDGFVSIEVAPQLANDAVATLAETRRLWTAMDRPNALVKIPGTAAGIDAIRAALVEGININITLLFSVARYAEVVEAYFGALEQRVAGGKPINRIRSVASFFVSRVDTAVDRLLDARAEQAGMAERQRLQALRSTVAVANAAVAYQRFKDLFYGPRWWALTKHGAVLQRPLWASTSTKDPRLPDTYYVEALIAPFTIDTVPLHTLAAFNDHGRAAQTLESELDRATGRLAQLAELGIDLDAVTTQLEREGIQAFVDASTRLLRAIERKGAVVASAL
jgi:transaldolase